MRLDKGSEQRANQLQKRLNQCLTAARNYDKVVGELAKTSSGQATRASITSSFLNRVAESPLSRRPCVM